MSLDGRRCFFWVLSGLLLAGLSSASGFGQQVVQRGALGRPGQVMDETQQWTTPLLVASDADVEIYIPDVSTTEWLSHNYSDYMSKGQYVLSMFTFYKTPKACRKNQTEWGYGDVAHLEACNDISYRVRETTVDMGQKMVTLVMAAMIGQNGDVVGSSLQQQQVTRNWSDLDANTQVALKKVNALVAEQMKIYDHKMQTLH